MRNISSIVVAAGRSRRFKGSIKKQFLKTTGSPLFLLPVRVLESIPEVKEIIVVLPKNKVSHFLDYLKRLKIKKLKSIVAGGSERSVSVARGLREVSSGMDLVLIQDGVRPFLEKKYVREALRQIKGCDGVVTGVPISDTIKKVNKSGLVECTVSRESLWMAQTPQIFKKRILEKAYRSKTAKGSTDDSQLVERCGGRVRMIPGSSRNIKVTTAEDIELLGFYKKRKS